jgi:hypothetical protein
MHTICEFALCSYRGEEDDDDSKEKPGVGDTAIRIDKVKECKKNPG